MTTQVKQDLQHLKNQQIHGAGTWWQELRPHLLPATQGLTLSFTWPELLSKRFRRYSSRHWLLPSDSWEISESHLG